MSLSKPFNNVDSQNSTVVRASLYTQLASALRIHHLIITLPVFVPLLLAHSILDSRALLTSAYAFFVWCLCAASVSLHNDQLVLEADRVHSRKRFRPLAS